MDRFRTEASASFRKLFNRNEPPPPSNIDTSQNRQNQTSPLHSPKPVAYVPMNPSLQKHMATIKYNMKIVIRGADKTGKSSLFLRLQGFDIGIGYTRTPQIGVATIPWSSPATQPQVPDTKVEIWDVVDIGDSPTVPDARSVDVYRYCTLVILMIDVTRRDTFEYIRKEAKSIPTTAAVLVLMNFSDAVTRMEVNEQEVSDFCESLPAATTKYSGSTFGLSASYVRTSMTSCLGLAALHGYLVFPSNLLRIRSMEGQADSLWEKTMNDRSEFSKYAHRETPQRSSVARVAIASPPLAPVKIDDDDLPAAMTKVDDGFFGPDDGDEPPVMPYVSAPPRERMQTLKPAPKSNAVKMGSDPSPVDLMAVIAQAQSQMEKDLQNAETRPKREKKDKSDRPKKEKRDKKKAAEDED